LPTNEHQDAHFLIRVVFHPPRRYPSRGWRNAAPRHQFDSVAVVSSAELTGTGRFLRAKQRRVEIKPQHARIPPRARWGGGAKTQGGIKTFFLIVVIPIIPLVDRRSMAPVSPGPSPVFSVPPAPRIVSVFFLFLLRGLAACLNKHRAIDVAVIIAAEGTASHPLRCSLSSPPLPPLFSVFSMRARASMCVHV